MARRPRSANIPKKMRQALQILEELGFPRQQVNERSALTLLALLDLKPGDRWSRARAPLMGITPMMEFFAEHYGVRYAPNTRETVRRQTVHQFVQAGLAVRNPDDPSRPTNSPKTVYQTEPSALKLVCLFGRPAWRKSLKAYVSSVRPLRELYAREREMERMPVVFRSVKKLRLSPGAHNVLVKKVLDEFCPLFTPGGRILYVGDTQKKWAYLDPDSLQKLGVGVQGHGKMPDLVVHYTQRHWLVLIEAVTSHGPVDPKRRRELSDLFAGAKAGIVYVTAFMDRRTMTKYVCEISWETEVWVAESPTHLIHFNGERFLGPYE